jgi:hypothetical protein
VTVRTDPFFDGSYWEASPPEGWAFRQDKSVRGYPHVFESPSGCRIQIGTARALKINYGVGVTRPGITSEAQRIAYVSTREQAWLEQGRGSVPTWFFASLRRAIGMTPAIEMHTLSGLVGFTHPLKSRDPAGWAGWFAGEPWSLFVRFTCPAAILEEGTRDALAILDSIRFRESPSTASPPPPARP